MVDETAMLLDRWTRHATHGVNALAQALPRLKMHADGTIGPDEWDAPAAVTCVLDQEDSGAARELDPTQVPAFITFGEGQPVEVEATEGGRKLQAFEVVVGGAYVTAETVDPDTATREAGAYLRANRISFLRYNTQSESLAYRELNDVHVLRVKHVASLKLPGLPVGASRLWGLNITKALVVDRLS